MAAKKKPQPQSAVTGRFESTLSRALLDKLCKVHAEGKDFRNVTAVRCGVHPKLLGRWLKEGAESERDGLKTELFLRFCSIEGDIRAAWIAELENTQSLVEHTEYDDGKPISKTSEARRTNGIQWLMERRFRQFRADWVPKDDERDASEFLQPQQAAMSQEMVLQLMAQLAAEPWRLPDSVRTLFAQTNWSAPRLETSHGEGKQTH